MQSLTIPPVLHTMAHVSTYVLFAQVWGFSVYYLTCIQLQCLSPVRITSSRTPSLHARVDSHFSSSLFLTRFAWAGHHFPCTAWPCLPLSAILAGSVGCKALPLVHPKDPVLVLAYNRHSIKRLSSLCFESQWVGMMSNHNLLLDQWKVLMQCWGQCQFHRINSG